MSRGATFPSSARYSIIFVQPDFVYFKSEPPVRKIYHLMLPRHLRSVVVTAAAPAQIRALFSPRSSLRLSLRAHPAISSLPPAASFHSSSRRQNELPKSPFQTFVDVLKEELRKNRELQDNVKQLQGDVDKLQDSEAMKKARAAYERARVRLLALLINIDIDQSFS